MKHFTRRRWMGTTALAGFGLVAGRRAQAAPSGNDGMVLEI